MNITVKIVDINEYPYALTVKDTAEILRTTTKTVYKMLNAKIIPSLRVGRRKIISRIVLEQFITGTLDK